MKTPVDYRGFLFFDESDLFTCKRYISTIVRKFCFKMKRVCINMIFFVDM